MFRLNWKKLFLAGVVATIGALVLQSYILPYPLTEWFLFEPVTVSSEQSLNQTLQLSETMPLATIEQIPLVPTAPLVLLNSMEPNQSLTVKEEKSVVPQKRSHVSKRRRRKTKVENKPQVMPTLLPPPNHPHRTASPQLLRYISSLTPIEALMYAREEIKHAPVVIDDPELYAPLFRNLSVFKRSYELMEMILKVYVYPDGARPIFHQPYLRGIYASEGWFMRLLEGNRQFITKNPEKAHLFYLPYSARQLQLALYVPDSHNMKPLSIFLRDYVNLIAAKYPFWNRTHGADHFLVACHDWGPYTVNGHKELSKNTIKALCNADLSEGIFVSGKDVSLPETTIRTPRKPLQGLGGKRVSQRPILAFFAGNMHGRVRPNLLKHWGDRDEDMKIYGPLPNRVSRQMSYVQHMKSSKFCICPMGFEVNSPRIVEAIYYECVPVIIADNFSLPFDEVLDWSAFSVIVPEKDIPNLKEILLAISMRRYLSMQINVKMLQKHFLWNPRTMKYDLFHMVLHSIWSSRLNQIQSDQS